MSTDPKSLAAEIEAVILRYFPHSVLGDAAYGADRQARCAVEIAALQSRAFEDGERSMRRRAEDVARAWMMPKLSAAAQEFMSEQHIAERRVRNETVIGIAGRIAALPLQPEGERNA